jgi:hypothetical protein|tara:strand:+ start:1286 stop:2230 length:945 start_codon:yes stop_codon:yes gene_type:complete
MTRSKRTQAQIQNKAANEYNYIGDDAVAQKLKEIEFAVSSLETIDAAMMRFIDDELNLSVTTNEGFKKVPVLWVTSERSYQIKHNKDLRDKEEMLVLPLITVNRSSINKNPNKKGTVYANLYPVPDAKGGVVTIARQINQKKTSEFQNNLAARKYGPDKTVSSKMKNTNKRNMSVQKVVYETITIPIPTWISVNYEITLRSEYQQQVNELLRPFITIPGNSPMPKRINYENHYYEVFINGDFANGSNQTDLGMTRRNYENTVSIEVLGYLIGDGENQEKPKIVRRENAVEYKLSREKVILGDIPDNIKGGFYRD